MKSNSFARWILDHSKDLKLKVQEATWTKEWAPKYYSLNTHIEIEGRKILGHGLSQSQDIAFIKSASEAIERAFCIGNDIHSNGVAAFTNQEEAKIRASYELKERDAFLCHYLLKYPFLKKLEIQGFDQALDRLKENHIKITALQMKTPINEYGVVCFATPIDGVHSFSSIIGLGYSDNLQISLEKAFLECLESTVGYLYRIKDAPLEVPSLKSSLDHKKLFLTSKYKNLILSLIENIQPDNSTSTEIDIQFSELQSKNPIFSDIPLLVMKSTSRFSQSLFYGETKESHINFKRLEQFLNRPVEKEWINYAPHCIG